LGGFGLLQNGGPGGPNFGNGLGLKEIKEVEEGRVNPVVQERAISFQNSA
jgi:hypothetical protein